MAARCRDLLTVKFSGGAVDQAMQARGVRMWMWVSRTSRLATICSGQAAGAMLWRRMNSGSDCPDSAGGAEIMLLATDGRWQRRGLAAALVSRLCAVVAAAAPLILWAAVMQPINAVAYGLDGIFVGAGDQRFLAVAMVAALVAFGIGVATASMTLSLLHSVWVGLTCLMLVRVGSASKSAVSLRDSASIALSISCSFFFNCSFLISC